MIGDYHITCVSKKTLKAKKNTGQENGGTGQKSQTQVNEARDGTTEIQGQSSEAWIKPKNRRRLAVRGSLQEYPDIAKSAKKSTV